jgi:hypothetical protein
VINDCGFGMTARAIINVVKLKTLQAVDENILI